MLYSASCDVKVPIRDKVDELRFNWTQLNKCISYLRDHKNLNKRIVFSIDKEIKEYEKYFNILKKETNDNYTIQCASIPQLNAFIAQGYNAYYKYPATDWEMFHNLRQMGVSDILIDGPIGFCGKDLEEVREKYDIIIRANPVNSASALFGAHDSNINTFFIRPEDIHFYEKAIDIIEFNTKDFLLEETLIKTYIDKKSFHGDLSILINKVNTHVFNQYLPGAFAIRRYNCRQECKVGRGNKCQFCFLSTDITSKWVEVLSKY